MLRVILLLLLPVFCFSQSIPTNKDVAIERITALKDGALIVRLKTNDKSVSAYRNSGQHEIADRIEADRERQNLKIIMAFKDYFDFCKVYFIYASATNDFLAGQSGLFLGDDLKADKQIKLKEGYFLFAEYGILNANMQQDGSRATGTKHTQESSTPSSNTALFITDTALVQLQEPFPFAQVVLLDNYHKAVDRLNNSLHRFHFNRLAKAAYKYSKKDE